jgi:hypothetical protein
VIEVSDLESIRGKGEFLGGDTREEGYAAYRSVIEAYEGAHPGRYARKSRQRLWDNGRARYPSQEAHVKPGLLKGKHSARAAAISRQLKFDWSDAAPDDLANVASDSAESSSHRHHAAVSIIDAQQSTLEVRAVQLLHRNHPD